MKNSMRIVQYLYMYTLDYTICILIFDGNLDSGHVANDNAK